MNDGESTGYLLLGAELLLGLVILDPYTDASTKGTALGALCGVLAGKVGSSTLPTPNSGVSK